MSSIRCERRARAVEIFRFLNSNKYSGRKTWVCAGYVPVYTAPCQCQWLSLSAKSSLRVDIVFGDDMQCFSFLLFNFCNPGGWKMETQKSLVRLSGAIWALQCSSARIEGVDTRLSKIPDASASALRQWWSSRRPRHSKNYGSNGGCRRCAGVRSINYC